MIMDIRDEILQKMKVPGEGQEGRVLPEAVSNIRDKILQTMGSAQISFAPGFDEALVGVAHLSFLDADIHAVLYDVERCKMIMTSRKGLSEEDAFKKFCLSFGAVGIYLGPSSDSVKE